MLAVLVLASSGDFVSVIFTLPVSLGDIASAKGLVSGDLGRRLSANGLVSGEVGRRLLAGVTAGVFCFEAGDSGLRLLPALSRCISSAVS